MGSCETHSDARFYPKRNLVHMLWCMENYIRDARYFNDEVNK